MNLNETYSEVIDLDDEFGSLPGETQVLIETQVHLDGTVDGQTIDRTVEHPLEIDLNRDYYRITSDESLALSETQTRHEEVTAAVGPLRSIAGPIVALLAVVLLAGVVGLQRSGSALSSEERAYLAYVDDRADFDEWITTMRVPESVLDRPTIEADRLADLVDYAIDADEGVIEDADRDQFLVIREEYVYVFDPPTLEGRVDRSSEQSREGAGVDAEFEDEPSPTDGDADSPAATD